MKSRNKLAPVSNILKDTLVSCKVSTLISYVDPYFNLISKPFRTNLLNCIIVQTCVKSSDSFELVCVLEANDPVGVHIRECLNFDFDSVQWLSGVHVRNPAWNG